MGDKDQILQRIKASVSKTAPGATLILYGSYARGDNREDSDIDLLVLIDKDKVSYDDRAAITYPLFHIEFETGILISPKVFSREIWETRHNMTPFYRNVTSEGRIL